MGEHIRKINHTDSIKRFIEKDNLEESSPMDPPDAYKVQNIEPIPYENMHPFLQSLVNEHLELLKILNYFESALLEWRSAEWIFNPSIDQRLNRFFSFYDEHILNHNRKEEKILFPILNQRLIETNEHSKGENLFTSIDIMEDDHLKIAQAVTLVLNFLGLGSRLIDKESKSITFDYAFNQGLAIIETFRLHIHREEKILFPQAMHLFNEDDFKKLTE